MAGQKQPIDLVIARGKKNLTKAEIEERRRTEVKAPTGDIVPPDRLTDKQKESFLSYAERLVAIDIFTDLDIETLATYVISVDEMARLDRKIRKVPLTKMDEYKAVSTERERIFRIMQSAARDLGLTISSRCKLVIPDKEKEPENKFDKFIKSG